MSGRPRESPSSHQTHTKRTERTKLVSAARVLRRCFRTWIGLHHDRERPLLEMVLEPVGVEVRLLTRPSAKLAGARGAQLQHTFEQPGRYARHRSKGRVQHHIRTNGRGDRRDTHGTLVCLLALARAPLALLLRLRGRQVCRHVRMEQLTLRFGDFGARGCRGGLRRGLVLGAFAGALEWRAFREAVWRQGRVDGEEGGRETDGLARVGRGEGGPGGV